VELADLMYRPGLLDGERILVTGGGSGLGRVMAEAFLILGAEVYICGRRQQVLEATARELMAAHGGRVVAQPCDIRSDESIVSMLDAIWADGGGLSALVNNAAGNFISRTEDLSPRGFDAIANIVFRGAFVLTQECGKRWIAAGEKGSVLSILVAWIWNGAPYTVPSAMSKAGINVMTKSLAVEWGPKGIRLNAISPGAFPTEGVKSHLRPEGDTGVDVFAVGNPLGRSGEMAELANLAVYLLAPGSEYVNGQTISIDGGFDLVRVGGDERKDWTDEQWAAARDAIKAVNERERGLR
jgi:NAD(P)-dependent dehydrogenase (short-subunit alcohol dehydrogenase family)